MNSTLRMLILIFSVTSISYIISSLSDYLLLSNDLVVKNLAKSYKDAQISDILEKKSSNIVFFFTIKFVYKLLFVAVVSSIISIGMVLNNLNIKWISSANIVTVSSLVFLIPAILKIFWFLFIQKNYTYEEFKDFNIMSVYNIVGHTEYWLDNCLKQLTIFEALFWLLLSYRISSLYNFPLERGMTIISLYYGLSFIVWLIILMYIDVVNM